jgi:hypothetical protein
MRWGRASRDATRSPVRKSDLREPETPGSRDVAREHAPRILALRDASAADVVQAWPPPRRRQRVPLAGTPECTLLPRVLAAEREMTQRFLCTAFATGGCNRPEKTLSARFHSYAPIAQLDRASDYESDAAEQPLTSYSIRCPAFRGKTPSWRGAPSGPSALTCRQLSGFPLQRPLQRFARWRGGNGVGEAR